jgi:uncharacterized LabA/DUF88 family protein
VTTQNTHHEHNDVDLSVVEYPSASNTPTVDSTSSEDRPSPEIQGEVTRLVEEQISTPIGSQTKQDTKVPSASNQTTMQIQNPLSPVNHADSSTTIQAIPETSIPNKTVAHGDEVFQGEVQPQSVLHESQENQQSTTHEEIDRGTGPTRNEDRAPSEETPTQPSEISLPMEETQTGVNNSSSPTASVSADTQVPTRQSEQPPAQPEVLPEETDATPILSEHATETFLPFPSIEIAPLINTNAEEVRPFTQFIEEFRLAEAERLQSALRESQVEAFALLNSVETISPEESSTAKSATLPNGEDTEITGGTSMHAEAQQPINTESKDTPTTEQKTTINPANRPVSPLLRPATRLRVPRHGLVRHQREELRSDEVPLQKAQADIKAADTTSLPAPTSEPVSPKPARRYRFDRPSTNAKNPATTPSSTIASTLPNSNGSSPSTVPAAVTKMGTAQDKETREAPINRATQPEPPAPAQEQEEITPEAMVPTEPTATAQTAEQGRRRQMHKEPATPTQPPVVEAPMPIREPSTNADQIAPEDLPPLEYSELQKGSPSRRRRRHRSGSSSITGAIGNTANEPATPVTPVPPSTNHLASQIASMPQIPPQSPIQTPAGYQNPTNGAYNIVSGYTLNQMNQGNEIVGPFMGPEPSPARGSVLSRDGRAARAETHRGPSSFASRPVEHGLHAAPSAASMAQFANIVSQAIQTQTDRMVTELRRANQAPANVSVNLPPFPSTERVGVFVDVANLLYSARTLRIAVDFGKLLDFLRGNRRLVRAHAYCPTSPQPGDEQMFLQAVKGLGYRITTKNYKTFSSGAKKADLDLDLCMDVVRLVDGRAVDCIVLVSGDSDFMPMLDYCSDHGVRVEVAAFDEAMSATLRQSCDLFVNLSMLEEIRA